MAPPLPSAPPSLIALHRAGSNANRPVFPGVVVAMIASCGNPIIRLLVVLD